MLIFLYGPNNYLSRKKLKEIIEQYKKVHRNELSLKYFDLKKSDFKEFQEEIHSVSMFGGKKLIVLENAFFNFDFEKSFLQESKKILKSTDLILFYERGKVNEGRPLFKFLKNHSKCQEFNLLDGQKLKNWIFKEFESYQVKVGSEVIEQLINFVGNDLWQLNNEIRKLISYKYNSSKVSGVKQKIEVKDIELLVKPKIETDIFETIDALSSKNKKRAISLIHKHLRKGDNPLYLLSMINFQFRNLLEIKDMEDRKIPYWRILRESKLHPFIIKKSYQLAKKFSLEELKKIYQKIFQVDFEIKTGKIQPEIALDLLIAEI